MFEALFSGLFKFLGGLFSFLQQNQLVTAGQDKEIAKNSQAEVEAIEDGIKARDEARAANAAIPSTDGLPDDGFRRD